jgi:hypothetical protein
VKPKALPSPTTGMPISPFGVQTGIVGVHTGIVGVLDKAKTESMVGSNLLHKIFS